jgi:hypothetical protein
VTSKPKVVSPAPDPIEAAPTEAAPMDAEKIETRVREELRFLTENWENTLSGGRGSPIVMPRSTGRATWKPLARRAASIS